MDYKAEINKLMEELEQNKDQSLTTLNRIQEELKDALLCCYQAQIKLKTLPAIKQKEFVQCQECGNWFIPTKRGMRFCPPKPGQHKSNCANRFAVREHQKRKSIKEVL